MTALPETPSPRVGENLRKLRMKVGWTQQDLADHAGLDRASISQIENGRMAPRSTTIEKLAAALRVDPVFLWQGEKPKGMPPGVGTADASEKPGRRIDPEDEVSELQYEPLEPLALHPGLEELLNDDRMRLMLGLTADEERMLCSIRTRSEIPLTKDFFIDVLIAFRRHRSDESSQEAQGE